MGINFNRYYGKIREGFNYDKDFSTHKQDDGNLCFVSGIRDGWKICVSVAISTGNSMEIFA